jgi:transposase
MHYTPIYSSWINQVERWFGYLTDQLIRRGDHHSAQALETDIRAWVDAKEVADLLRMEPQWVPDRVTR